jgi:hypothetical protein
MPGMSGFASAALKLYDSGRFDAALELLRTHETTPAPSAERALADATHCRAAFRVGRFAECCRAATRLLQSVDSGVEAALPSRFNVLTTAAVAEGSLGHHLAALEHLRELPTLARRLNDNDFRWRAYATAATCFALLGDPPGARAMFAALAARLAGLTEHAALRGTVLRSLANNELRLARAARAAGRGGLVAACLGAAEQALGEEAELAQAAGTPPQAGAFRDLHRVELLLFAGDARGAERAAAAMLEAAGASPFRAQVRQLTLLRAEALLDTGDAAAAMALLAPLDEAEQPPLEAAELDLDARLLRLALSARCAAATGHAEHEADALRRWKALSEYRRFGVLEAAATYARVRLETEALFQQAFVAAVR